ncbi:hypothetical protein IVB03_39535 [Bradyrhizobium sp. 168]|uniref:hypothetical protein n=1 Tax=Bradyrhizobium sp. 168 TaxID=2782639 RepID=UPI001FFA4914|nr:hypothetical protein [Bradyrhizobium sp. 168]MCK1585489.1 hypothetical protein [Bradyrhizobium sp. 168]
MATTSDLTVINAAATRTGNDPVAALSTDGGPVAAIALNNYEDLVKAELSLYPWKRATKIAQIDRLDADVVGDPPEPWSAAYRIPTDLVDIRSVRVGGYNVNYEVHGTTILCDASEGDEVILQYVWRVPESEWPPWFREGVTRRMEAMFLRAIGERHNQADERDAAARDQFALAKNRDSQSQTPRDPMISPTLAARTGTPGLLITRTFPPR